MTKGTLDPYTVYYPIPQWLPILSNPFFGTHSKAGIFSTVHWETVNNILDCKTERVWLTDRNCCFYSSTQKKTTQSGIQCSTFRHFLKFTIIIVDIFLEFTFFKITIVEKSANATSCRYPLWFQSEMALPIRDIDLFLLDFDLLGLWDWHTSMRRIPALILWQNRGLISEFWWCYNISMAYYKLSLLPPYWIVNGESSQQRWSNADLTELYTQFGQFHSG